MAMRAQARSAPGTRTTGELTINLFGGDTVTGTVTDETEIKCASEESEEPVEEPATKVRPPAEAPPERPAGRRGERSPRRPAPRR